MDNTQNFSGFANDYTIGRPAYANAFIESLYSQHYPGCLRNIQKKMY